jgi:hypothetical protein
VHGDAEHCADHGPEHPDSVEQIALEVHSHDPCEHACGQEEDRDEREQSHDVVRPLPMRATRRSNEPRVDSFASRADSTAWASRLSRAANRSAEPSAREEIELGMREGDDYLRWGERTSQSPDRAAQLDQPTVSIPCGSQR